MIIFYNKSDGRITGTVDGRIHGKDHMNIWVGDKDKTGRVVVNWKKLKSGYHPSVKEQSEKKIYEKLDKDPMSVYTFKVDTKTKKLIKKHK